MLHDKAYRIPSFAATETFENPLGRGNNERRGLLLMERTQAKVISSSFLQNHKIPYHFLDTGRIENGTFGIIRYPMAHAVVFGSDAYSLLQKDTWHSTKQAQPWAVAPLTISINSLVIPD